MNHGDEQIQQPQTPSVANEDNEPCTPQVPSIAERPSIPETPPVSESEPGADAEPTRMEKWFHRAQKVYRFYVSVIKALIATIGFIAFLFIAHQTILDIFSDKIVIKPFSTPLSLEERGYTGDVILSRLIKKMEEIRRTVSSENNPAVEIAPPGEGPDIEIPGAGVSLQSIISYLTVFLGNPPLEVTGSVVLEKRRT